MPKWINTSFWKKDVGFTSQRGSVFLFALVMVALISLVALIISSWQLQTIKAQRIEKIKTAAGIVKQNILYQIYNSAAWASSTANNTCLFSGANCAAGAHGILTLKNTDGSVFYDSAQPGSGFNLLTQQCDPSAGEIYQAAGSDQCPFRYDLNWSAINCLNNQCQIQILGVFHYSPSPSGTLYSFSPARWDLNFVKGYESDSLQSGCHSLGGAFDQSNLGCAASNNQVVQCPAGYVLRSVDSNQSPTCEKVLSSSTSCPSGQGARGIASLQQLDCADLVAIPTCTYVRTDLNNSVCTCANGVCTQPVLLVSMYTNTNIICNQSTALQPCVGP